MTKYSHIILSCLLALGLLAPSPAEAQYSIYTMGSILPATGSGSLVAAEDAVRVDLLGFPGAAIQVTGTYSGTITFEVSADGTNYIAVNMTPPNSTTAATTTTSTGLWSGSTVGFKYLRARMSSYTSGTAVVTVRATLGGGSGTSSGGSGSNAAASATGSAVPASADYKGLNIGGTLTGATGIAAGATHKAQTVAIVDASGNQISSFGGSGGTSVNEDVASADAHPGTPALAVRKATPANTSGTDGDYEFLQMSGGRLWASAIIDAALPAGSNVIGGVTQSGTWNVTNVSGTVSLPTGASTAAKQPALGVAGTASTDVITVQGIASGVALPVSGTITCTNCSGTGVSVNEDIASANADPGTPAYAVRKATPANTSGADGDYEALQMAAGRLWTSATIDTALPAGTNAIGKLASNTGVTIGAVEIASSQTLATVTNLATIGTSVTPGTSAAHLGKAEDAAHSSGDTGVAMFTKRTDTAASSAGTDGDYATFNSDANGRIWTNIFGTTQAAATYLTVRLSDGTNFLTPGTDYAEDVASAGAETGPITMTIRQDTPAGTTSADGDYQNLKTDSVGRLWINCGTGCSGGTQYADGAVYAAGNTGTLALAVRKDSAAAFTGVADGDFSAMQLDSSGALRTNGGVINNLPNTIGSTTSGESGALVLGAVTTSAPTYTTAQSHPLSLDTTGALRVTGSTAGTQYTHDAALTVGSTVGTMAVGRASAAAPTDVSADGDAALPWYLRSGAQVTQLSAAGALVGATSNRLDVNATQTSAWSTTPKAGTDSADGASNYSFLSTNAVLSAQIKGSAGNVYDLQCYNNSATMAYIRLYNQTGAPGSGDGANIVWRGMIPASASGAGFTVSLPVGRGFSTGIGIRVSGLIGPTDTTALTADTIVCNVGYK